MVGRAGFQRIGANLLRNQSGSSTGLTWQGWRKCISTSRNSKSTQDPIENKSSTQPPLTQPLPGLPTPVYATLKDQHHITQVTTLKNGLQVASENRFGQFCTVGVVIDSGSRYEVAYPSGISHFLEKLAFNSTTEFPDKDKIMLELEKHGGICDCQSSRDTFIYASSADRRGMDSVVRVLGEVILRPQISLKELAGARQALSFELENLYMRPEQETILMDMIHAAAYRDNTLGLPKICPEANVLTIDRSVLFTYLKHHYTPRRMVVAGVGVEHNALVESVQKYFVDMKPIWEEDTDLVIPTLSMKVDDSVAQYTGGMVQEECTIPLHAGMSGLPELAHVVIGLEGFSHQDHDFIPICVLNMMMGGGGSFSAGGPGKGMYTRLYTNVLNRHHWMFSATAYNHAYLDSGLFCIHASAPPAHVNEMVEVLVKELVNMAGVLGEPELQRAKRQLQSMLLMNLEARPVVFEDIARQVLATGHRKRPEHFIKAIEDVTAEDIHRVARQLLKSQPSIAARGDIHKLPSMADIQAGLLNHEGKLPGSRGRLSLFR
ncbi:mitochondrial-processing peptidase subunit alpha [Zootermopsis nevadensis]|uniref:Mitochondrial-processing peptidase subunit alpha n=1 Tax=Zootermopsis nevadensis TaxID=136037 RepID=A0A067QUT1_ZOONE|nr:mitochondrial-processing peptidase subunit alpha [Zootermopsis nevadensis]KDR08018.1 Mitochondrial-processing peptidase subunit alpha [Zootermopsis nevadensis]